MMAKREFLMLAQEYSDRRSIGGWLMSEKLDGWRCFWDGGISRGLLKREIGWANVTKDERYVDDVVCTGLWSRYGNVIHAPDSWLDGLPSTALDGELYCPGMEREELLSRTKKLIPDVDDWEPIKLYAFDCPSMKDVLTPGMVDACERVFKPMPERDIGHGGARVASWNAVMPDRLRVEGCTSVVWHKQIRLAGKVVDARTQVDVLLEEVSERGGEGLMLRRPDSVWEPYRSWDLLKVKKLSDMEVTVVGYRTGKVTAKGSRNLGCIGSLICESGGKTFSVSGMNDLERVLSDGYDWSVANPDTEDYGDNVRSDLFPIGSVITIQYRGMTSSGIPTEVRYWRKRDD